MNVQCFISYLCRFEKDWNGITLYFFEQGQINPQMNHSFKFSQLRTCFLLEVLVLPLGIDKRTRTVNLTQPWGNIDGIRESEMDTKCSSRIGLRGQDRGFSWLRLIMHDKESRSSMLDCGFWMRGMVCGWAWGIERWRPLGTVTNVKKTADQLNSAWKTKCHCMFYGMYGGGILPLISASKFNSPLIFGSKNIPGVTPVSYCRPVFTILTLNLNVSKLIFSQV